MSGFGMCKFDKRALVVLAVMGAIVVVQEMIGAAMERAVEDVGAAVDFRDGCGW